MVIPPFSREFLVGTYIYIYINIYIIYDLISWIMCVVPPPITLPETQTKISEKTPPASHPSNPSISAPADPLLHHRKPNHACGVMNGTRWSGSRYQLMAAAQKEYGNVSKTSVVCLFSLKKNRKHNPNCSIIPQTLKDEGE